MLIQRPISDSSRCVGRVSSWFVVSSLLWFAIGCGFGTVPITSSSPLPLANNWDILVTPSASGSFSRLRGSILLGPMINGSQRATSTLIAEANCFALSPVVPLDGAFTNSRLTLHSFEVRYQYLDITADLDLSQSHLLGTYVVYGGCGNGQHGTITGDRYAPVTGSYAGASGGTAFRLVSAQALVPTGEGTFLLSGTFSLNRQGCVQVASLVPASSYVFGNKVHLTATLTDGVASLEGTFTPDATVLMLSAINVIGGSCSGSYLATSLTN